jgi:hypothetical protein
MIKEDEERIYSLILPHLIFSDRNLERKADMELSVGKMTSGSTDMEVALQRRFNVICFCEYKSLFVNIDGIVLYAFTIEICPELNVGNKGVTGEGRDTYWKNIFDFKRPKPAKERYSRGASITMWYT